MNQYFQAAIKLHQYIVANHWGDQALLGADPSIRFKGAALRLPTGNLSQTR